MKQANILTNNIERTSLIRCIYRSLLNSGRTYAAFNLKKEFELAKKLADRKEILDPMSGYGSLTKYCGEIGVNSYCLEFNPPMYLWQVLVHPANADIFINAVEILLAKKKKWPSCSVKSVVSDDWFPEESKKLIVKLLGLSREVIKETNVGKKIQEELSLALILPFVGRLSCYVSGDIVAHVKKGGMCVYHDWQKDFAEYLNALTMRLFEVKGKTLKKTSKHIIVLGDSRTIKLPKNRFAAMLTSPPYPNQIDYSLMFGPENVCLLWLAEKKLTTFRSPNSMSIIGSLFVSRRTLLDIRSKEARRFLNLLQNFKGTKKAEYDINVYYIPYYSLYFSDLEKAYTNIAHSLKIKGFEGYIVVVNNTARNQVIPVAQSIIGIWKDLGFQAKIVDREEKFHVGTKNPHARGLKAKHTEYTIKIWR